MTRRPKIAYCLSFILLMFTPSLAEASKGDSSSIDGFQYDTRPKLEMTSAASEQIYSPGHIFLDAGIHLGVYNYGYGGAWNTVTPMIPLTANLEVAALDFIGIGGYFGFATQKYEYEYSDWDKKKGSHIDTYEHRYTYTSFGAKGQFHVIPFLDHLDVDHGMDGTQYDLYIAHYLGVRLTSSKWVDDDVDDDVKDDVDRDTDASFVFMNPTVGGRYMFSDFFGVYAEVGYGHWGGSDLEGGLSFRF